MRPRHIRLIRRLTYILAAAPLFQIAQCQTGVNQVLKDVANSLPSTLFSIFQSLLLSPLYSLLGGGGTGTGAGGGF